MRKTKLYLVAGFLMGVVYAACGGAGGVADTVAETLGSAVDVVFSNVSSGLTATTVQGAVDEIDERVDDLESATTTNPAESIIGEWSGTAYYEETQGTQVYLEAQDTTITFDEAGTFSCSGDSFGGSNPIIQSSGSLCSSPGTWAITGDHFLKLTTTEETLYILSIENLNATSLELQYPRTADFYVLSRVE